MWNEKFSWQESFVNFTRGKVCGSNIFVLDKLRFVLLVSFLLFVEKKLPTKMLEKFSTTEKFGATNKFEFVFGKLCRGSFSQFQKVSKSLLNSFFSEKVLCGKVSKSLNFTRSRSTIFAPNKLFLFINFFNHVVGILCADDVESILSPTSL